MKTFVLSAVVLLVSGCSSVDPCSAVAGACLGVHVVGPGSVDQLHVVLTGAAHLDARTPTAPGAAEALPADTAVSLPATAAGAVEVTVTGYLRGANIGRGVATVEVTAGQRQTVDVTLVNFGDSGITQDLAVPVDLGPTAPDLGFNPRYVFLLPPRTGALGSQANVDLDCTTAAGVAKLPGNLYKGIVDYRSGNPGDRINLTPSPRPIVVPSGKIVAYDTTFFSSTVDHVSGIDEQASKLAVSANACIWTNFSRTGTSIADNADCNDWVAGDGGVVGGFANPTALNWSFAGIQTCNGTCHVYCIQQ